MILVQLVHWVKLVSLVEREIQDFKDQAETRAHLDYRASLAVQDSTAKVANVVLLEKEGSRDLLAYLVLLVKQDRLGVMVYQASLVALVSLANKVHKVQMGNKVHKDLEVPRALPDKLEVQARSVKLDQLVLLELGVL